MRLTVMSLRSTVSLRVALAIGLAIHLDWHLARPMDQRLSMGWSQHWLLALPLFLVIAWYLMRRWPVRPFWPTVLSVGVGILLDQVLEPLGEVVRYGDSFSDVSEPDRVRAFVTFLAAGIITLGLALAALPRAEGRAPPSKLRLDEVVPPVRVHRSPGYRKRGCRRMFGIPGEVFWPTAAIGTLVLLVIGGIGLLRFLPHPKSRVLNQPEREALEDLQARLGQLDQLQERIGELEERVDFAERILAKQREGERLGPPKD